VAAVGHAVVASVYGGASVGSYIGYVLAAVGDPLVAAVVVYMDV
jgi:hypothetical protein